MLANNGLQATPTAALLINEKHLAWVSRFSWGVLRALEAESLGAEPEAGVTSTATSHKRNGAGHCD